jgi:1,4-dihydroxy-2-naphthoate octaprenyltransferase
VPFNYWVQAARLKFLPQGVLPVFIGGAAAFADGVFHAGYFALAFLAAAAVQVGLTMFNDTLDFQYGTDRTTPDAKNPFSGGSGILASGRIAPSQAMRAIVGLYVLALAVAVFFAFVTGPISLGIAAVGAAISIVYSARPFRLAYRGLGELSMLVGYGPVITGWAYYVHSGTLTGDILLAGLVPGLCMWTMILINEIPDYAEDRAAGKKNLTYRLGPAGAKNLFIGSLAGIYAYSGILIAVGIVPVAAVLIFAGLPLAFAAARSAARYYRDPLRVAVANKYMVMVYSVTNIGLTLGFIIG